MQMVKNIFIGLVVFWFALFIFMPKEALYYALEEKLEAQGLKINEKSIETGMFSLNLIDADIYFKGINVAHVKKINIFTLLFTTNVNIKELTIDASLKAFAPEKIDQANITHLLLSPMKVNILASGSFGNIEGVVDLKEKKLRLDFSNTTKEIDLLRGNLQKDEKGLYYETSF
jgi:hypothetical protein